MTISLPVRPTMIRLEASSFCQLQCPSCPTAAGKIDAAIGRGYLRAADFAGLLDDAPNLRLVELSNYGEIFLNPELPDILRIACQRGVAVAADNGVNLNTLRPETLAAIVRFGMTRLTVSIDGSSPETYARYRVRGDFGTVMANLQRIVAHKRALGTTLPELKWQFIVFGHNEHELPEARRLADSLGMDFVVKLSWDENFSPLLDPDAVRPYTGVEAASRSEYRRIHKRPYMRGICTQLWDSPQVNWDGRLLGCCRNFWGDFRTNVFRDGLEASLNSEPISYARRMLKGEAPARNDIPCTTCDLYRDMRDAGCWMRRDDLAEGQRGRLACWALSAAVSFRRVMHGTRTKVRQIREVLRLPVP